MNHIVDTCPRTKFEGGLNLLHEVEDDAVIWLESTALVKIIIMQAAVDTHPVSKKERLKHLTVECCVFVQ